VRNEGGGTGTGDDVVVVSNETVEKGPVELPSSWAIQLAETAFTSKIPGKMDLMVLPEIAHFLALRLFSEK
jgi:hypothetical protein